MDDAGLPQDAEFSYRYLRHCNVDAILFPTKSNDVCSIQSWQQVGQLVWVCRSKGRRRKNGDNSKDCDKDGDTSTESLPSRLELFERATILEVTSNNQAKVRYPKNSTYTVPISHLKPIIPNADTANSKLVVVASETSDYRYTCVRHILPSDNFIEIGCASGLTCHRVYTSLSTHPAFNGRLILGIDKGLEVIEMSNERYGGSNGPSFLQRDVLGDGLPHLDQLAAIVGQEEKQYNITGKDLVVAIDIGGNRDLPAVRSCLQSVIDSWVPRLVIVKSEELNKHLLSSMTNAGNNR